ncbi:unnamed protein product [Cyclocybe aegerita]|uniref:Uncharacterized protein n=1 Tax=Cyclocybe aegerita TaxID=1973307 RepID=A0A8S0WDH1_CYCAE|nr:unnamed protein product [Cyclocybe aegerita]
MIPQTSCLLVNNYIPHSFEESLLSVQSTTPPLWIGTTYKRLLFVLPIPLYLMAHHVHIPLKAACRSWVRPWAVTRCPYRAFSGATTPLLTVTESEALRQWTESPPSHTLKDSLNIEHLADLYITLPTRDGTRRPSKVPGIGESLPFGHHLGFFHARRAEQDLRADATDSDISPPAPFTKRMWAGGRITWDNTNPLLVGKPTRGLSTVARAEKKGFDKGKPTIFITQKIEYTQDGQAAPSVVEERAHVYFHAGLVDKTKKVFDREVKGIPENVDFSIRYIPTPVTLFRYSALMFNAHHIHLDKEYCQKEEGYPASERIVHGPLTAQMLLEAIDFHYPGTKLSKFEYRATNPLFANRELSINGAWVNDSNIQVWCQDTGNGVVGMNAMVEIQT